MRYGEIFKGCKNAKFYTLPHKLIKEKRVDLIERAFKKFYKNEDTLYLACNDR